MESLKRGKILIVDDIKANINLLSLKLKADYDISAAYDGESALKQAAEDLPDLILLDIKMPGIDGYEVCRRLKADKNTENIPIIFVTSKDEELDEAKGLELGAIDYIRKPFSISIVKARVKNHFQLKMSKDRIKNQNELLENKIDKIQRYMPQGLTEKILAQKSKIEGERKQVTVMFCDMVGYTALSEEIGPEDAYSIMDQVYEILIYKVHEFGGTVNEMTGDGVLALFGAPISIEDAPQRAIRVAMAIHREMAKFNENLKKENPGLPALKMRAGIHTGPVVVGTLGNDLRVEFKAVGDTVNLASRMETMAEPGTTYVTEDTFKLTEGMFRFEALGEKAVKGKKDPVRVFRVIAISSRRTKFDVSAERGLTPFAGREQELDILLDGFERARAGRGQAFSIMAEAGVGKSRLLYEFRKAVSNEDITFLEGKCLSYSRGVAYHPVIDILKSNFNVLDNDDAGQIRKKVFDWLKLFKIDEAATLPYILELFSVKDSGIGQMDMSPEARKERIMSAVNRITLKGAESRPLVLAVEDLHWVDHSSEEYLKYLLESISGARVFLIFTYRLEYLPTWGGKSYHSQINLNRLSNRESLNMVAHLLGTEAIDKNIEALVLEKAEGVPFFIEQFIRTLKHLKIIEASPKEYHLVKDIKDVEIPSTVQDVIMSRVDSLPEGGKELLQVGSVIDREFTCELIQKVTALSERELLSRLYALKDSELIYERGIFPESTYIFKHALTQEVVCDSILGKRKKRLHEKIARAIEELYQNYLEEHYEVLAEHFIQAENFEAAEAYCRLIYRKAAKKNFIEDAIAYAQKRLNCLERLPQTDDIRKKIIDTRTQLGFYYLQMYYFVAAKEAVAPIAEAALKYGHGRQLSRTHIIEGAYNMWVMEDMPEACRHLDKAIQVCGETNDFISLVWARAELGAATGVNCEFEKAAANYQCNIDLAEQTNSKWGLALPKSSQSYFVFNFQGKSGHAYKTSHEAVELAEESGDILSKAHSYTCHGIGCYHKGFLEEAESYLLKASDACDKIDLFSWGSVTQHALAEVHYETGDYKKVKNCHLLAALLANKIQFLPTWQNLNKIGAARAMVMNRETGFELESIYKYISDIKVKIMEGWQRRYLAEVMLHLDGVGHHLTEAEEWIRQAIEADQKNSMMFHLAKDYALFADILRRKDDTQNAKENLKRAIQIFEDIGADGWTEKYENQLAAM